MFLEHLCLYRTGHSLICSMNVWVWQWEILLKKMKTKKKQKNIDQNSYLYHRCIIAAIFYFNKHRWSVIFEYKPIFLQVVLRPCKNICKIPSPLVSNKKEMTHYASYHFRWCLFMFVSWCKNQIEKPVRSIQMWMYTVWEQPLSAL